MEQLDKISAYISSIFYTSYLDALKESVRIPSLSALYDPDWQANGNLKKQADHMAAYFAAQGILGAKLELLMDEGRSPFIIVNVDAFDGKQPIANSAHQVLLYGHLDKQPVGDGWTTDPWEPVIKDGKLFGRGGADDCYAFYSAVSAIKACQVAEKSHPKCVITIEGSEEGDLDDLIYYLGTYKDKLGNPDIVVCLDAGAAIDSTASLTTSLRGVMTFDLKAKIANNNIHSGLSGGVAPNPYWILNSLLKNICNTETQVVSQDFHVEIPEHRLAECRYAASVLGAISKGFDLLPGVKGLCAYSGSSEEQAYQEMLNNYWRPCLAVTGQDGIPSMANAANATLKEIAFRISMRLPPTLHPDDAKAKLTKAIQERNHSGAFDYTYGSQVELTVLDAAAGFDSPKIPDEINEKFVKVTGEVFGNSPISFGSGGSIPFMEIFAQSFPASNFLLTGCVFSDSNIHAANENLDLEYCRKFTTMIGKLLSEL